MHLVSNMAFVGDTPWHGLGNQLSRKQPIEVWARQAGMDWTIESADVRFVAGTISGSPARRHVVRCRCRDQAARIGRGNEAGCLNPCP
ncbi:hypothetical protein C6Q14_09265 [Burkholderia ambifaria]|nr:hypothetical protein [Burkholderia ambifaria]PRG07800.1 hypothetical protein C6Q14_09265 [Burkholderia ambifaria]